MTIDRIPGSSGQPAYPAKTQAEKKTEPQAPQVSDQVTIGGREEQFPKIMVGAPTARLAPYIDEPNVHPAPIALEIANGVGIGIDGESIIVGPGKEGTIEVTGHLEDGTYPQRDYKVTREGNVTKIDGYYDWQDYTIEGKGNTMHIAGETPRESFDVSEKGNTIDIKGQWPVQNYAITKKGSDVSVKGYDDVYSAKISTQGNVTTIKGGFEERDFTVTRENNSLKVDGKMAYQDFTITWDDKQIVVTGCYPHQKQVIKFKA
ncbi:MAG: hypothetical protein RDV48_18010 [Candidatus Eremiobacteraeota bacterium]|nr:hypothetical protein [Candidatus Eremiobacteraeota bacterium]